MDLKIDAIQMYCIQWFLATYHIVTEYIYDSCKYTKKIYNAIQDVHREKLWVFLDPNTTPIQVRGNYTGDCHAIYRPDEYKFKNDTTEGGIPRRFHVVIAELERPGQTKKDMTEIFHKVTWNPGSAPSLVEMVLLQGLYEGEMYPLREIKKWKLVVLDDNAEEHTIQLDREEASERFRGWPQ